MSRRKKANKRGVVKMLILPAVGKQRWGRHAKTESDVGQDNVPCANQSLGRSAAKPLAWLVGLRSTELRTAKRP